MGISKISPLNSSTVKIHPSTHTPIERYRSDLFCTKLPQLGGHYLETQTLDASFTCQDSPPTSYILESLVAVPPVTLCTLS